MNEPQRPTGISEYTQACLDAVAATEYGDRISLGDAFGLAHYFEYRKTHDVDAWWQEPVSQAQRDSIIQALVSALERFGKVRTRSWGDVVSVELQRIGKTIFSFQIAHRSARLEAPISGLWPGGIRVDNLQDLVASKMVALVERGAPRDFRDIYRLCQSGQVEINQCWKWWNQRQRIAQTDTDRTRADLAIMTHLARLEQARPLRKIADEEQRAAAEQLRHWYLTEFLRDV